jgi:inorganic pyrophosphatase
MDITKIKSQKTPAEINVLIEIPKDSNIKYELDKESGAVMVDRFLYTAMNYPFNYGFVPGTLADDGDPLDVLVLSEYSVVPASVIPSKAIGLLEMEDEAGIDTKIIAVPKEKIDPVFGAYNDIEEIPAAIKEKIKHFFENYKTLEPGKWVKVKNWQGREVALKAIEKSIKK